MALILKPARWQEQPRGEIRLNISHPLLQGQAAFGLFPPHGLIDPVSGVKKWSVSGTIKHGTGPGGIFYETAFTTSDRLSSGQIIAAGQPFTWITVVDRSQSIVGNQIMAVAVALSGANSGVDFNLGNGFGAASDDPKARFVISTSTDEKAWVNGRRQSGLNPMDFDLLNCKPYSFVVSGTQSQNAELVALNYNSAAGSQQTRTRIYFFLHVGCILPIDASAELSINPWQLFEPDLHRTFHFIPAAQGGETVEATRATITFSGYDASLNESIVASRATITLTGYAAALHEQIVSTRGTVTFTGYQPSINEAVAATRATITFSGYAVTLGGDVTVDASRATITLSGYAPALNEQVQTTRGTITFSGYGAALPQRTDATRATVSFIGYAPKLNEQIQVTRPTITFSGYSAEIIAGARVDANRATITFGGYAAVLSESIVASRASITFTGLAATLTEGGIRGHQIRHRRGRRGKPSISTAEALAELPVAPKPLTLAQVMAAEARRQKLTREAEMIALEVEAGEVVGAAIRERGKIRQADWAEIAALVGDEEALAMILILSEA